MHGGLSSSACRLVLRSENLGFSRPKFQKLDNLRPVPTEGGAVLADPAEDTKWEAEGMQQWVNLSPCLVPVGAAVNSQFLDLNAINTKALDGGRNKQKESFHPSSRSRTTSPSSKQLRSFWWQSLWRRVWAATSFIIFSGRSLLVPPQ